MTSEVLFWLAWITGWIAWLPAGQRLRGLTIFGAWCWAGVVWAALGLAEAVTQTLGEASWTEAMQFAAAVGVFCPLMSVLGAKRPQDRGWHFVVLSLWAVLALPAAKVLFLHPGQEIAIHDARSWFLAALILVSVGHFLPTRFWVSGVLLGVGQTLWVGGFLDVPWVGGPWRTTAAAGCCCAAALAAWRPDTIRSVSRWDRLWRDYRNLYGALWSLRAAQRINEAAASRSWPLELCWKGFVTPTGESVNEPPADMVEPLETCLRGILRRFVSPEWIARRLEESDSNA